MKTIPRPILLLSLLAIAVISTIIGCSDRGNKPNNPGENLPPTVPTAITPADGATDLPLDFTLQWESSDPDGGALTYKVFIGTDSAAFQDSVVTSTNEYRSPWGVRAEAKQVLEQIYSMQWAYESEHGSFCLNGVSVSAGDSGFYANLGIVPDISDPYTYTMNVISRSYECTARANLDNDTCSDIWATPMFYTNGIGIVCAGDDINYPIVSNRTYYWKVVSSDVDGNSTSSPIWRFTTGTDSLGLNRYPGVPELLSPMDGETVDLDSLVFWWNGSDPDNDSLTYTLFLSLSREVYEPYIGRLTNSYMPSPWMKRSLALGILRQIYELETAYHSEHGDYCLNSLTANYEHNTFEPLGVAIDSINNYTYTMTAGRDLFTCVATNMILDNDASCDVWTIDQTGNIECSSDDFILGHNSNTTYFWRIAAIDQYGYATFSPIRSFVANDDELIPPLEMK
jgi:hypothetical protein